MDTTMPETDAAEIPADDSPVDVTEQNDDTSPEGAEALGDAGKKALDAMKAERKALKAELRELKAALAERDKPAETPDQPDADAIRREVMTAANTRILKSEIKAAAAGKLADPADALAYLDLSEFDVSDNGDVDATEIADAITELLEKKPYLAAATAKRFQGTGDGGARNAAGPSQLTRSDLDGMTAAQINQARKEGRLKNLLSGN